MIILDFEPIVQSIAGGFSVREFTVQFRSVQELDAKSILSLCALPLQTPVTVELPDRAADGPFLADIAHFRCDPDA